jgi:hypothetical protein
MSPIEARTHLNELLAERALASVHGLAANTAYMTDLDQEIAVTRDFYVAAAVIEIAGLRAELSGPQVG